MSVSPREVPVAAYKLVMAWEGLRLEAYRDSGGVWTVGYGHTGQGFGQGFRINPAIARAWLVEDVLTAGERLERRIGREAVDRLNDNQYAALLSFVFNLGAGAEWTIWRLLCEGRLDEVPNQMARFVHAGGVRLKGLVNRRAAEIKLWRSEAA
ncbi:lysozyme [Caulobacter segnis]|uniref:lysozyme n=1 Tax=Caulobacter segnis TaxID=88688 RepID=UPI00240FF44C|nr:lysozyme [Caulobacter segnis]MDG2522969.1 lysozyme [Caulobacter segnis]